MRAVRNLAALLAVAFAALLASCGARRTRFPRRGQPPASGPSVTVIPEASGGCERSRRVECGALGEDAIDRRCRVREGLEPRDLDPVPRRTACVRSTAVPRGRASPGSSAAYAWRPNSTRPTPARSPAGGATPRCWGHPVKGTPLRRSWPGSSNALPPRSRPPARSWLPRRSPRPPASGPEPSGRRWLQAFEDVDLCRLSISGRPPRARCTGSAGGTLPDTQACRTHHPRGAEPEAAWSALLSSRSRTVRLRACSSSLRRWARAGERPPPLRGCSSAVRGADRTGHCRIA
jgi:hypothetical protein